MIVFVTKNIFNRETDTRWHPWISLEAGFRNPKNCISGSRYLIAKGGRVLGERYNIWNRLETAL